MSDTQPVNDEKRASRLSREEIAERLLELVYFFAAKRGMPNWPILPVSANVGFLFDAPIPTRADISVLSTPVVVASDWTEGPKTISNIHVTRTMLASPKLARNHLRSVEPQSRIVQCEWYDLNHSEALYLGAFLLGKRHGQYVPLGSVSTRRVQGPTGRWEERGATTSPIAGAAVPVNSGIRCMLDASWLARLRVLDSGPAVDLPTDAEGMYALFKDRAAGGGRRKALLHWVKAHCRVTRDGTTPISAHLRGVPSFAWHGTEVRVTPPADSLERALTCGKTPPSVVHAVERYRAMLAENRADLDDYEESTEVKDDGNEKQRRARSPVP